MDFTLPFSFLIWIAFIVLVASIGIYAMLRAYVATDSRDLLFAEPIAIPEPLPTPHPQAAALLLQGLEDYRGLRYRRAIDRLNQAIRHDPVLAEAYHNRGRLQANLRQDSEAVVSLAKAADLYLQQGDRDRFEQVKQDLETIRTRSR